jgi:hypothetical protein
LDFKRASTVSAETSRSLEFLFLVASNGRVDGEIGLLGVNIDLDKHHGVLLVPNAVGAKAGDGDDQVALVDGYLLTGLHYVIEGGHESVEVGLQNITFPQ